MVVQLVKLLLPVITATFSICCCSAALSLILTVAVPVTVVAGLFTVIVTVILSCYWLFTVQGYESYDKSKLENTTEEDVQTKVRLTALMTLGTRSTHELKFAEVQQALGLGSDSEVEAWVVRAIGKVGSFLGFCGIQVCGGWVG